MSNNQLQPVKRQRKVNTIFLGELGTNPNNERADQLIKSSSSNDKYNFSVFTSFMLDLDLIRARQMSENSGMVLRLNQQK